ncbi:MAG: DNA mismatch repair protein MutS [Planctomycetia bacterium]|nr:DNA mismatch repair protein MutS [Planctomycetia bacterium]
MVGWTRLAVVVSGLLIAAWWLYHKQLPPGWLLVFVVVFVVLLFVHDAILRAYYRAQRAAGYFQAGLDRLADDWKGKGRPGIRFQNETHPYAADLDLFGIGSLFELLCTARTRTGEDTLAEWLRGPAGPDEIRARQAAVAELRPMLDLREDLALLGPEMQEGVDYDAVVAWGESPVLLRAQWPRWVALGMGSVSVLCMTGWMLSLVGQLDPQTAFGAFFLQLGVLPLLVMLVLQGLFLLPLLSRVNQVLKAVERRGHDLGMLARVLARLEQAKFTASRLAALHAELALGDGSGTAASQRIAQLSNLIEILNSRRNQFFAPFAFLLMWGTQYAHAIENWRAAVGPSIRRWLEIVGQFEALCALAAYAFENPIDPFPEMADVGPLYQAQGLMHPLLPRERCIANDVSLGDGLNVLIVSGSNMSGKSTFLRTIGINAVLALAGGPVRARWMRLSPLAIGATLRIQDSLMAGRSRFYAEILRVRQVVDLSHGSIPLLFLLDEIFSGTNSHDRKQGAEAVVCGLVRTGAIGLVTTHDLSLTRIADPLGERARNVHFADHLEDGEMVFDYRLQEGVVRHSNAIALMRVVGLEV